MYLSMSIITNKRDIEIFDDVNEKKERKKIENLKMSYILKIIFESD